MDPPIPSYEQATANPLSPRSPMGEAYYASEHENRSLLGRGHGRTASTGNEPQAAHAHTRARSHGGYRPPTVETDDEEDSTWSSSDSEVGEAAHVRREMQELEMEDPLDAGAHGGRPGGRASRFFGKTIGFGFALPRWRWRWRWPLPAVQNFSGFARVQNRDDDGGGGDAAAGVTGTGTAVRAWRHCCPTGPTASVAVFARILALVVVLAFVYLLFVSDLLSSVTRRLGTQSFDPESLRVFVQARMDADKLRDAARHLTAYAHMAGTEGDFAQALDVKTRLEAFGLEGVTVDEYYVYLNYPRADGRAVEVLTADGATATWSAQLEEDGDGDVTAGHTPYAFHGLSKSGDVRGPLIYAHDGRPDDFAHLQALGIDLRGAVALVRQHGSSAGPSAAAAADPVYAAALAGCAGVLVFSDATALPADGVRRGSVGLRSMIVGDVLTPGWESKKGLQRMAPSAATGLVSIPSLPLSWRNAAVLLGYLEGKGVAVDGWTGGSADTTAWWTGNASVSPMVRLRNLQDEPTEQPIWNVYGRIDGSEQSSKKILLGAHRDTWTAGSADAAAGTAVLLEVARVLGDLHERGWRPLRTIEFCSWDGSAYNLIGSTEYVEHHLDALRADALAYVNLDGAVTGSELHAAGSPALSKALVAVMQRVHDPAVNASLYDLWLRRSSRLGMPAAGSDDVPFQALAGTSSVDLRFLPPADDGGHGATNSPLFSAYETFAWLEAADPGFAAHRLLAEVVGLLLVELADRPVLPLDLPAYGRAIQLWTNELTEWLHALVGFPASAVDLGVLQRAADTVVTTIGEFAHWPEEWEAQVMAASGWEPAGLGRDRQEYNARMGRFESDLLDLSRDGGLPNRTQFRHVLFAPKQGTAGEADLFPGVRDAVRVGDWALANRTVARIATIMEAAAAHLIE